MPDRSALVSLLFQLFFIAGVSVLIGAAGSRLLDPRRLSLIEQARRLDARMIGPDQLTTTPDVLLIDVRPIDAYLADHLPGARHVPAGADESMVRHLLRDVSFDRRLVVYCASDCRLDRLVAATLMSAGFSDVWILKDGD